MKISKGKLYLFEERVPLRTHQILRKELSDGREALYISKHPPQQLKMQFDFDEDALRTLWLSPRPDDDCIPPMNLEVFELRVNEFLKESPDGIVALNGLDVLEMWNGLRPVLEVLKRARSKLNAYGTNFILSVDPRNMRERSVSELEKVSDIVVDSTAKA
ncbi:MAG TPA: DUF835 domain-containing protein [Methanomassiliicoccales archaeon]|nr:DUF835 domain-containing protein [Methanomassiliicoccales archaeon]